MSIEIISRIVPKNGQNFAVLEDSYIHGGMKTVASISERNNIPSSSRKVGMIAYVSSEKIYYNLVDGIENSNWEELVLGGGSQSYIYNGEIASLDNEDLISENKFLIKENDVCSIEISTVVELENDGYAQFFHKLLISSLSGYLSVDSFYEDFSNIIGGTGNINFNFFSDLLDDYALAINVENQGSSNIKVVSQILSITSVSGDGSSTTSNQGPRGLPGETGPTGPAGPPGLTLVSIRTATEETEFNSDDYCINVDGTFTVTLEPPSIAGPGRICIVKNIGAGTITIITDYGSIDGDPSIDISIQYQSLTFISDGSNWFII